MTDIEPTDEQIDRAARDAGWGGWKPESIRSAVNERVLHSAHRPGLARSILAHARTIAREAEKDATIARLREALAGLLPDFTGGLDPTEPDVVVRARATLAALGEQP